MSAPAKQDNTPMIAAVSVIGLFAYVMLGSIIGISNPQSTVELVQAEAAAESSVETVQDEPEYQEDSQSAKVEPTEESLPVAIPATFPQPAAPPSNEPEYSMGARFDKQSNPEPIFTPSVVPGPIEYESAPFDITSFEPKVVELEPKVVELEPKELYVRIYPEAVGPDDLTTAGPGKTPPAPPMSEPRARVSSLTCPDGFVLTGNSCTSQAKIDCLNTAGCQPAYSDSGRVPIPSSSSGQCRFPSDRAADGSRCGGRAASVRPGGR